MRLSLYYRSGCSLCEAMHRELLHSPLVDPALLQCVDVDADPELVARYGHKVPVLTGPDQVEICHYFLDSQALQDYFARS